MEYFLVLQIKEGPGIIHSALFCPIKIQIEINIDNISITFHCIFIHISNKFRILSNFDI